MSIVVSICDRVLPTFKKNPDNGPVWLSRILIFNTSSPEHNLRVIQIQQWMWIHTMWYYPQFLKCNGYEHGRCSYSGQGDTSPYFFELGKTKCVLCLFLDLLSLTRCERLQLMKRFGEMVRTVSVKHEMSSSSGWLCPWNPTAPYFYCQIDAHGYGRFSCEKFFVQSIF